MTPCSALFPYSISTPDIKTTAPSLTSTEPYTTSSVSVALEV